MNPSWNTIKPTGKTASLGLNLASIFSSLFSIPLPASSLTAEAGASQGGQEIQVEYMSEDGTFTGEVISVPTITYEQPPLADADTSEKKDALPDLSCDNPKQIITVGGIDSALIHPQFAWTRDIAPVAAEISIADLSISESTVKLRNTINAELAGGKPVLVVAHSLGAIIAFNLRDEFKGKPVEFISGYYQNAGI